MQIVQIMTFKVRLPLPNLLARRIEAKRAAARQLAFDRALSESWRTVERIVTAPDLVQPTREERLIIERLRDDAVRPLNVLRDELERLAADIETTVVTEEQRKRLLVLGNELKANQRSAEVLARRFGRLSDALANPVKVRKHVEAQPFGRSALAFSSDVLETRLKPYVPTQTTWQDMGG